MNFASLTLTLYTGNVSWTEEGHILSWHMKLRDERGNAEFFVTDPESGKTWKINRKDYLSERQARKRSVRPALIRQFSCYIAGKMKEEGYKNVRVKVLAAISLNGRRPLLMIDPEVDLVSVKGSLLPASWILPLNEPLNSPESGFYIDPVEDSYDLDHYRGVGLSLEQLRNLNENISDR